jgi:hypothetical protein
MWRYLPAWLVDLLLRLISLLFPIRFLLVLEHPRNAGPSRCAGL